MNRKTNIFYNTVNDSKFITFDNYSEALTGDILATNQKLWPSKFICMYVSALDGENENERNNNKIDFINNYLVPYYENKLAFLRDTVDNPEDMANLPNLSFLLSLIYFYACSKKQSVYSTISNLELALSNNNADYNISDFTLTKEDIDLCYISNIVEQDYNGIYADIICTISTNTANKFKPSLTFENLDDITAEAFYTYKEYDSINPNNVLYGWNNETAATEANLGDYIHKSIIFDNIDNNNKRYYYTNSLINGIKVENFDEDKLKFNVIIPVYDSAYIDDTELEYVYTNEINADDIITISNTKNVPLGIYFTGKPVELEVTNGMFNTSWSLLISMQFKSFPYSFNITNNFDDSDSIKAGYITFAEILAKQNVAADYIIQYNNQINELKNKISSLESIIKSMSTVHALDEINLEISKLKNKVKKLSDSIDSKVDNLEKLIEDSKLKWEIHKTNE